MVTWWQRSLGCVGGLAVFRYLVRACFYFALVRGDIGGTCWQRYLWYVGLVSASHAWILAWVIMYTVTELVQQSTLFSFPNSFPVANSYVLFVSLVSVYIYLHQMNDEQVQPSHIEWSFRAIGDLTQVAPCWIFCWCDCVVSTFKWWMIMLICVRVQGKRFFFYNFFWASLSNLVI